MIEPRFRIYVRWGDVVSNWFEYSEPYAVLEYLRKARHAHRTASFVLLSKDGIVRRATIPNKIYGDEARRRADYFRRGCRRFKIPLDTRAGIVELARDPERVEI